MLFVNLLLQHWAPPDYVSGATIIGTSGVSVQNSQQLMSALQGELCQATLLVCLFLLVLVYFLSSQPIILHLSGKLFVECQPL